MAKRPPVRPNEYAFWSVSSVGVTDDGATFNLTTPERTMEFIARRSDKRFAPYPWELYFRVRIVGGAVSIVGLSIQPAFGVDAADVALSQSDLKRVPLRWLRELVRRDAAQMARLSDLMEHEDAERLSEMLAEPQRGRPKTSDEKLFKIARIYFKVRDASRSRAWMQTLCEELGAALRDDGQPVPEGTVKSWLSQLTAREFKGPGAWAGPGPRFIEFQQRKQKGHR